jgi:predicted metal-dependent hydrolase
VIVHELCHLKEHNHGPGFWALVAVAIPDYGTRRKALRTYVLR